MPVVIDDADQVVIGHGRVLRPRSSECRRIPVIEIRHLSKAQLKALRIADNKLAQNAHWDERLLGESFSGAEGARGRIRPVDHRVQPAGNRSRAAEPSEIGTAETREQVDAATGVAVCQAGELWQLGEHRIDLRRRHYRDRLRYPDEGDTARTWCSSTRPTTCRSRAHVSGKGKVRHREFAQGVGELSRDEFIGFLTNSCGYSPSTAETARSISFAWTGATQTNCSPPAARSTRSSRTSAVWVKSNPGMGSLYRSQHELIFVFKSGTGRHTNNVELGKHGRNRTNVWNYDSASVQARKGNNLLELHPTAKPVELVMDALLDCSNRGGIVLDCFLGSGTTLLAAERTGRNLSRDRTRSTLRRYGNPALAELDRP